MKPIKDLVIVHMDEMPSQTKSGIYIGGEVPDRTPSGKVIAVGDMCTDIKVGERVLMAQDWFERHNIDGKECAVLHESEIVAVLEVEHDKY